MYVDFARINHTVRKMSYSMARNKSAIGKEFEREFTSQCKTYSDIALFRLKDSADYRVKVATDNPCDFLLYYEPILVMLELKATQEKRLDFSKIRESQWKGLNEFSTVLGVFPGILVWFYKFDKTYFIPIEVLNNILNTGRKSITIDMCDELAIELIGNKKRKFIKYDLISLLNDIKSSI